MEKLVVYAALLLLVIGMIGYISFVIFNLVFRWNSKQSQAILNAATHTIGIPASAVAAFALVWLLPAFSGDEIIIKTKFLEISGTTSQIILWIICFFAFILVVRILRRN